MSGIPKDQTRDDVLQVPLHLEMVKVLLRRGSSLLARPVVAMQCAG